MKKRALFLLIFLHLMNETSTFALRPNTYYQPKRRESTTNSFVSAIRFWLPWTSQNSPLPREPPKCTHFDLKLMTVCFERYFSYFDIPLAAGHLLPPIRDIYTHLSRNSHYDYAENQERFDEFAACYLNAPESCYKEENIAKIASRPEEADFLVTFFTVSEYVYKSQSNRQVLACFREVLPELPRISGVDMIEERCRESLEILNMAMSEFSTLCRPLSPAKGQLFTFVRHFVTRTALGRACPTLLTRLNINDT